MKNRLTDKIKNSLKNIPYEVIVPPALTFSVIISLMTLGGEGRQEYENAWNCAIGGKIDLTDLETVSVKDNCLEIIATDYPIKRKICDLDNNNIPDITTISSRGLGYPVIRPPQTINKDPSKEEIDVYYLMYNLP